MPKYAHWTPIRRLPRVLRPRRPAFIAERLFLLRLEAFDWNCPQHITPRYTAAQVAERETALRDRVAELEAANAALAARLERIETI